MYKIGLAVICTCLLSGCSDDDVLVVDERPLLTVVASVGGLGDMGYNDKIMSAVMNIYEQHDICMSLVRPNNMEEAKQFLQLWLVETEGKKHCLLVLAGNEYESLLKTDDFSLDDHQQILLFESRGEGLPEGVTTFWINRYGTSYLAGCMAKEHGEAAVIAAMPHNPVLEESIAGFTDGYRIYGGSEANVIYLANDVLGFDMADSAYRITSRIDNAFIFPLTGGSNSGIYKYSRETDFYLSLIVGMDVDCSMYSNRIPFSMVIHIDRLVEQYLTGWINGVEAKKYQVYGLETGMIDIIMNSRFYKYLDIWENYYEDSNYWRKVYQTHKEEAISKENEYEADQI